MKIKFKRADKDLSVAYVSRIQKETGFDTVQNGIKDATLLTDEELDALGYKEAKKLYDTIIVNTFGESDDSVENEDEKK